MCDAIPPVRYVARVASLALPRTSSTPCAAPHVVSPLPCPHIFPFPGEAGFSFPGGGGGFDRALRPDPPQKKAQLTGPPKSLKKFFGVFGARLHND